MARSIWNGSLSFGLVSVPVELFSATEDKTIHFNQFQAGTSDRIRNRRVNERTGEEVPFDEIVKGYDLGGGEYVIVSPDELEALEPGRTRNIEITDFVDLEAIDPVYYQKTYYLAPKSEQAERAYALLRRAMEQSKRSAVATLVMRGKQYLVTVRAESRVLVLQTMYFADEVRDPTKEVPNLPVADDFSDRELKTAKLLIDSMATDWEPERYHDTYRQRVEDLVERKRAGEEVVLETHPAEPTKVVDLMAALQASVDAARGKGGRGSSSADTDTAKGARSGNTARRAAKSAELSELSKAELYDRAAELDVQGRSKMTRRQLEQAVAAAGSGGRRRKAS
ncbi:MAG TPA: Ku protein [Acidimicrobiales bacterium]|nr:Ku protein [Acidimicrobiales bacterium]